MVVENFPKFGMLAMQGLNWSDKLCRDDPDGLTRPAQRSQSKVLQTDTVTALTVRAASVS